jgi:uncharacterized protein YhjY with autotransporter beta-barrel domain
MFTKIDMSWEWDMRKALVWSCAELIWDHFSSLDFQEYNAKNMVNE